MDIDMIEVSKALSNETRLNILKWLKAPEGNFPPQGGCLSAPVDLKGGVCVSSIQAKANLSPSTVSNYLDTLQRSGLLLCERHGKWTYYRRNEGAFQSISKPSCKPMLAAHKTSTSRLHSRTSCFSLRRQVTPISRRNNSLRAFCLK